MVNQTDGRSQLLFWGCFMSIVATAFGFVTRMFLITEWQTEFNLDAAEAGRLAGIGIWPFAVGIIGFSLFIDKIGYKVAMTIAFVGHIIWAIVGFSAYSVSQNGDVETAYQMLYWGSLIMGLANGTVEAFANPVVATMFSMNKTKWLNILHAGWPGGLVIAGIIVIFMGDLSWNYKVGLIAAPALLYFLMLVGCRFPVQERVASGVSYREMLGEFGILGALVVGFLVSLQLMDFFKGVETFSTTDAAGEVVLADWAKYMFIGIGVLIVVAYGAYTRALGRPFLFFMVLIMMPLATTELGTDGWITGIMEGVAEEGNFHPGWVLVYTSAIMMVLRFCAGPIVHRISPLGLLAVSAVLAIVGLYTLSLSTGMWIFGAATLYAFGKTFFWPTMLGVVAEQTPRGGAMTLNAIAGIGMLTVGTLGTSYIGALQSNKEIDALKSNPDIVAAVPGLVEGDRLTVAEDRHIYEIIPYRAIDPDQLDALLTNVPEATKGQIATVRKQSNQGALADMAMFPAIMLVAYLILIVYFKSKGGYKAEVLAGHAAEDEKFTGGVEGAADR